MTMNLKRSIILAAALCALAAGTARAGLDVALDVGGAYETTCGLGVIGVTLGFENDLYAECGEGDYQHVICAYPGTVDWALGPGVQVTVVCEGPR